MNKYYRAQEERNGIIKILDNLSFDEKKEVLRIVDQSMINSANNVLHDDPPGKPITRLPTKHKSEVQAKAVQMGRKLLIKFQVDELIKRRRKNNIKIIK